MDQVTFKILQELGLHNQNSIKQFLHLVVVSFTVGDDLADVIDWPMYLVDVSGFLPLYHQGRVDDLSCCRDIEEVGFTRLW
jgi:hypothetical protein